MRDSYSFSLTLNQDKNSSAIHPLFTSLAFSPDSQHLVTGGDKGEIRLWNISDPKNAFFTSLEGHATTNSEGWDVEIDNVAFTPNGKHLISGDWRQDIIHIWDISSNKLLSTIHDSYVLFFMISPDGNSIVYRDNHDMDRLFFMDISPFVIPIYSEIQAPYVLTYYRHTSGFTFHHNGQIFAFGTGTSDSAPAKFYLSDIENQTRLFYLEGHTQSVHFLAFSPAWTLPGLQ